MLAGMRRANAQHLGRIGHLEVARQFLSAGIWAYPTVFPEAGLHHRHEGPGCGRGSRGDPFRGSGETVEFGAKTSTSADDHPDRRRPPRVYEGVGESC